MVLTAVVLTAVVLTAMVLTEYYSVLISSAEQCTHSGECSQLADGAQLTVLAQCVTMRLKVLRVLPQLRSAAF